MSTLVCSVFGDFHLQSLNSLSCLGTSKPKSSDFADTGPLAPNTTLVSITNGPRRGWGLRDRKAEPRHGLEFSDAAFCT